MGKLAGSIAEYVFHQLPNFKGRWRILKILNQVHRYGLSDPVVEAHLKLGFKMKVDLRSRTQYESFYTGEYDHKVITAISNLFEAGWAVLDVGANVGFYAVPFAQLFSTLGSGKIHCFEPLASNFRRLQENLKLNGVENFASIYNLGLSNQEGTALITLREDFVQ